MYRFLITLLSSYNEYILYLSYNSIINQINHNLDYTILIVVNSLNQDYYKDVCKKFESYNVQIIQTQSNGKPGMGHNSVLELFKNKNEYDYLIPIDGDDFLYPYALHQLSKILIYNPTIVVGGNEDYICNFKDLYNNEDCYDLDYKYFLYSQPNIPINKTFTLNNEGTPFRLILLHKSIFSYNIDKFYCEQSAVFDDYLFYLNVLQLYYTTQCNIYYITLKNIYFYYKAHISSACYQNSSECNDDISSMIQTFPDLLHLLNSKKSHILLKLPILYIDDPTCDIVKYKLVNNGVTYEKNDFINTNTYKLNYNFANELSKDLYNNTLQFIESKLVLLNSYTFSEKKKLYLILENYVLNNINNINIINIIIIKYLLIISNNINYIANDIIDILLDYNNINTILTFNKNSYKNEFNNKNYINCYLITYKLLQNSINKSLYYYYYSSIMKLYNSNTLLNNSIINLDNNFQLENKKTIILLDYMDIDYTLLSPFTKGLGGTQCCYIYLAVMLADKYNIIILNKKKENTIIKQHNIHIIKYVNNENMIHIINNISPDVVIYNFIKLGELLRNNTKTKLYMYEHITVYSNFDLKINSNYYDYYDKIIFVSTDQYDNYKCYTKINKNKVIILNNILSPLFYYNSLSNNFYNPNNNETISLINKKKLNIIYISNPQRGLECFTYIFPILKKKYPNITLDIYSSLEMYDIEDNDKLKKMYGEFKNIDGINYNKSISQFELIDIMNQSLLFIYPTFVVESFCNSMVEAMSCGCYVISTNIGALKSVAYPYGKFIDIHINDKKNHPYYESINNIYIDTIVEESSKIIDLYLNKSLYLDNYLKEQINYVKKMYKNNTDILIKHINQ